MKIEERVKQTVDEVSAIIGERRSEDNRGAEDAGIGTIPYADGGVADVGGAAGTEKLGHIPMKK